MCTTLKLSSGHSIPVLGLGTWKSQPGQVTAAVKHALSKGYRHLDCAAAYCNETEVGDGMKQAMQEHGIKREDIFVTSKLFNNKHHPDDVESTCKKTLSDLGLAYLDLYLIHWPHAFKRGDDFFPKNEDGSFQYDFDIHPTDTWLAMEKLVEKGLVRSIGLSNFNSVQIQDVLDKGKIKPVVNQVECHPYFNQSKLLAFCQERDILLQAYSPLGSPDRPWATPDDPKLLDDPKLADMAKAHGKTPAQIVIRWQIQRGLIVLPKSVTPSRIEENLDVFGQDFVLSETDMATLNSFHRDDGRIIDPKVNGKPRDIGHPHYPFKIEF